MATHSGILVWRIPWTEETGGLQSTSAFTLFSPQTPLAIFLSSWFPSPHVNVCLVFYSIKSSSLWLQILDSHSCQVAHQLKVNLLHVHSSESRYSSCFIQRVTCEHSKQMFGISTTLGLKEWLLIRRHDSVDAEILIVFKYCLNLGQATSNSRIWKVE